jgi:outer membrane protein assembly factor BamB
MGVKHCCVTLLAGALALALVQGTGEAARVKAWHHSKPGQYEKAKLHRAVVSSTGALRLARHLEPFAKLDATHVWALAEDRDGNLYAGTGDEGKVYKVAPGGKVSVAYTSEQSQVLSLTVADDGSVLAGTGPSAQVVRLGPGKAKVLCELEDASYVWALAVEPRSGAIYAATGPKGRIYRIDSEGKARVFYDTKQEHVLCLTVGPDGTVYAGTDKTGRVYKIDGRGKGSWSTRRPRRRCGR